MIRRRVALGALSAVLASVVITLAAGGGVAAESTTNLRAAEVHPTLLEQLQANPTGGVTAVVTAWDRSGLDEIKQAGVDGITLKVLPMVITASLTSEQLEKIESSPAVRSIWPEEKFQVQMEDTTWITKARYVWASSPSSGPLKGYGVTGKGIELAMIDTGFDGLHEDGDNLIEYCDTTNIAAVTSTRRDVQCTPWDTTFNNLPAGTCGAAYPGPSNTGPGPTTAPLGCRNKARGDSLDQDVSHGTHVGGTIVGTGHASGGKQFNHSTTGMAPDAKFRAYSANVGLSLLLTQILASYDDMTYKKEQGYSKVIAVNNSWGGGGGSNYAPNSPQSIAFKRAYDAGIVSVFSAGNSGPEHNTLGAQCVSPWVVCVAANTKPDQPVAFSSKGRPSQPSDTNRDGQINSADVPPDNHDRLLGQRLNLGVYRPTLTAPGVAINSMKAIGLNIGGPESATCREDDLMGIDVNANCYVQAQGTSMSAPHVTGAIGLIGEAFKQERGRVPRPAEIIDILERSANTTKLPGWEAEEQGAGRLDVHQAVRLAKRDISLRRPNFGHPTPPYVTGSYGSATTLTGCTGSLSWSARSTPSPGDLGPGPVVPEPVPTGPRYGQHFITVAPNTERLRITIRWPGHPTANLYALLWRPGVNPDTMAATPDAGPPPSHPGRPPAFFHNRAFPDQEATGLPVGLPPTYRLVEVRAPEETDVASPAEGGPPPTIPSGKWVLRVYHRAGGVGDVCTGADENPNQLEGFDYTLRVERPRVTYRPSAKITSPLTGTQDERFVPIEGRAGYPPHTQQPPGVEETTAPPLGHVGYSWEGITNWEVPGSAAGSDAGTGEEEPPPDQDTRTVLYLHGNDHATSEPGEQGCSGKGETDVFVIGCGPFLLPDPLSPKPVGANFGPVNSQINGVNDRSPYDPNWVWCLDVDADGCPPPPLGAATRPGPKTVQGPMTVEWWASTIPAGQTPGAFTMGWTIRLWADDVLRFQSSRIEATPAVAGVPDRLKAVVTLPRITANRKFVLHIDANELDIDQEATFVYYDSENPCTPTAPLGSKCNSLVKMPVVTGDGGGGQTQSAMPENVRVTDLPANPPLSHPYPQSQPLSPALRVAWDAQNPAPARYEVFRSTDPAFTNGGTRVFSGAGTPCTSPQSPNGQDDPNGHDRQGLCYTDTNVSFGTVYYYRVVAVQRQSGQDVRSPASEIAYGMPTRFDRQVKLKVDRLYGPQFWEYALVPPSPTPPDTTNTGVEWEYLWDTLELTGAHRVFARSFTQGIGSTKDGKVANLDDNGGGGPGPGRGCPDDDDGDGDDDGDDGDDDDDGDDRDDDCEDDDDDEEEDDD
jgi:subtilisin family serine protease